MASGLYANAKDYILKGNVDFTADTIRALLYNNTSTIATGNPRGSSLSSNLGFQDTGVDDLADFSTLGEYLPGDSSSALTRQTLSLETSHDSSNARTLLKVTDGSGTGQAISFGSLAAATAPAKGVLFFHRSAKATATFTFGDTEFDDTDNATITLTDYAGKTVIYTISNDYGATGDTQFNAGANLAACVANFKAVVEASANHNGTITVTDGGSGAMTLTQAKPGRAGNQPITNSNWDSICDTNVGVAFTGGGVGSGSDVAATDIPIMAVDLPSTVNGNGTEFKVQFTDDFAIISL